MRDLARAGELQPALPSTLPFMHSRAEVRLDDPAFEQIVAMVERGQYLAAAVASQERWLARSYDVRVLGYFLYGVHLAQGTAGLPAVFEGACDFLSHWDLLGPDERKAQHVDSTLHWLFRRLAPELERAPASAPDRAALQRAAAAIPVLRDTLEQLSAGRRCVERLQHLAHVIEDLARVPVDEHPEDPAEDPAEGPAEGPAENSSADPSDDLIGGAPDATADASAPAEVAAAPVATRPPASDPVPGGAARDDAPGTLTLTLTPSTAFTALLRKLAGFEALVVREDFQRAAILAASVQEELDRFDPRAYFPQLLAPFFRTLSAAAGSLAPWIEDTDSFAARALAQHCRVDLEGFLSP